MITLEEIILGILCIETITLVVFFYIVFNLKRSMFGLIVDKEKAISTLEFLTNQNKILNHEIDKSKQISKAFYPKKEHISDLKFDICGLSVPSHKVSGDYYDVFTSSGSVYFGIGDVTGHGLTSSILSLVISRKIRTFIELGKKDIPSILDSCNNEIITEGTKYMSLLIGRITPGNKIEAYGKQESIVVCKTGALEVLDDKTGFILGNSSFSKDNIPKYNIEIEPNEFILLYSDGVTELENSAKQAVGIEGIKTFINNSAGTLRYMSAAGICQEIVDFLATWGADYVEDDITLLVIKRK